MKYLANLLVIANSI